MDITPGATGLAALVMYGAGSYPWLHGNPNVPLPYMQPPSRAPNSQFTYHSVPFEPMDGDAGVMVAQPRRGDLGDPASRCDLIGRCYLDVEWPVDVEQEDPLTLVEHVRFRVVMPGRIEELQFETLFAGTIAAAANRQPSEFKPAAHGRNASLPLPFFFCNNDAQFPLASLPVTAGVRFECALTAAGRKAARLRLVYEAFYLDTVERRALLNRRHGELLYRVCLSDTAVASCAEGDATLEIDLLAGRRAGPTKDLQVLLDSPADVTSVDLYLNNALHVSLNRLMAMRMIPRQLYGCDNEANVLFVPLCHRPADAPCSDVNIARADMARLVIRFATPGARTAIVVSRGYNCLEFRNANISWVEKRDMIIGAWRSDYVRAMI